MSTVILRPTADATVETSNIPSTMTAWQIMAKTTADTSTSIVSFSVAPTYRIARFGFSPPARWGTISNVRAYCYGAQGAGTIEYSQSVSGTPYYAIMPFVGSFAQTKYLDFATNPSTASAWAFADLASTGFEAGVRLLSIGTGGDEPSIGVTFGYQFYFEITYAPPRWKAGTLAQHTFLKDGDAALKAYLTDATITHADVASLVSFLSVASFEVTARDPVDYGKGMFPRVHIFTPQANTISEETRTTVQMEGRTTLKVWTLDTDPNTAASQNAAITGAVVSAIQQGRYVESAPDWVDAYCNWGDPSISVSMPEFVPVQDMAGLCKSTITVTWGHFDA